jgi:transcriptional regulator with GAF, ATPase, and Fis domain
VIYDVQNNHKTSLIKDVLKPRGTYTLVIVPLVTRGEVIGTIGLDIKDPKRTLDDEEINLLNQVSAQVSTALDQIRLFQAEQRGREAASALLEITQIASSTLDMDQVLMEVSQRSAVAVQAYRSAIILYDDQQKTLTPIMYQFADPTKRGTGLLTSFNTMKVENATKLPLIKNLFKALKPMLINGQNHDGDLPDDWKDMFGPEVLLIPMVSQDQAIGLMVFDKADKTISNANLFEQTVRRAERERLVADITSKVRASNDPQTILQTAVRELRQALGAKHAQVLMETKTEKPTDNPESNGAEDNRQSE